jgi:hypothetical protein
MEELALMTPKEILETSIASGIHTKNGKLTARYRISAG